MGVSSEAQLCRYSVRRKVFEQARDTDLDDARTVAMARRVAIASQILSAHNGYSEWGQGSPVPGLVHLMT